MYDFGLCVRWKGLPWADCGFHGCMFASLPGHLVYLHGARISHYARPIMVSEYSRDWYECSKDLVVLSDIRSLFDGDITGVELLFLPNQFDPSGDEREDISNSGIHADVRTFHLIVRPDHYGSAVV